MIEFQHVTAGYDQKIIFSDFSFTIPDRGRFAVMGPSGCGKTTFLNLICGLIKPYSGQLLKPEGLRISYLFQEDRLFPWFSAFKNVSLVSDEDDAINALKIMEIEDIHLLPFQMSGGMNRRVALARAVAFKGDILLLDEPFKGLDDELKCRIIPHLLQCAPLILMTTHDERDAQLMKCEIININPK